MKKLKKTAEERAADCERSEKLTRELEEAIERYRVKIEKKRAAEP